MSHFRSLSAALLSALTTFSLVTASSCGTNAVGVDACRDIEQARCRAGEPCGIVDDVPACERFYRDHCLHGLGAQPPAGASVSACVQVIEAAGRCAQADPESALGDCAETVTARHAGLTRACDVVEHPELADECTFLTDMPVSDGAAGQGAGGQTSSDEASSGGSSAAGNGAGGAP